MSIKHVSLMVCGLSLICGSGSLAATGESAPITVSAPDFIIPLGGKSGTLDIYFDGRPAETSGFNVLGHQRVLLRANSVSSGMVTLNLHLPGFLLEDLNSTVERANLQFTVKELDMLPHVFAPGVTLRETGALTAVNGVALVNPLDFASFLPSGTRKTDGQEITLNPMFLSQFLVPGVNFAEPFVLSFTFTATATSRGLRAYELYNGPESIASIVRLEVVPGQVPEPTTLVLAGLGAVMASWKFARRRKS